MPENVGSTEVCVRQLSLQALARTADSFRSQMQPNRLRHHLCQGIGVQGDSVLICVVEVQHRTVKTHIPASCDDRILRDRSCPPESAMGCSRSITTTLVSI